MEMGYLMKGEPPSWLEPDVSVTDPDQPGDKYYQGAPMIAIEIISPSERSGEVQDKIRIYLTNGAKEVWTFYERNRTAYAYTPDGKFRIESAAFHSDLLPGLEIPFEEIFR